MNLVEVVQWCSDNNWLRVMENKGHDVCPQDERVIKTDDSLLEDWGDRIMATNPPFKLIKKFIANSAI